MRDVYCALISDPDNAVELLIESVEFKHFLIIATKARFYFEFGIILSLGAQTSFHCLLHRAQTNKPTENVKPH